MSLDRISLHQIAWLAVLISIATLPHDVDAYYCDHDLCSPNTEYCCGDNLCCDYASSWWSWYLWISLIGAALLLSLGWGCARMCAFEDRQQRRDGFNKVVNKFTEVKDSKKKRWFEDPEASLLGQGPKSGASKDKGMYRDEDLYKGGQSYLISTPS